MSGHAASGWPRTVYAYRVGFLADLHDVFAGPGFKRHRWRWFWYVFRRDWRRRSYWNGWLAEPVDWPTGLTRCGSGWTKSGALLDLRRRVQAIDPAARAQQEPRP